jgi:hypothetical protein
MSMGFAPTRKPQEKKSRVLATPFINELDLTVTVSAIFCPLGMLA